MQVRITDKEPHVANVHINPLLNEGQLPGLAEVGVEVVLPLLGFLALLQLKPSLSGVLGLVRGQFSDALLLHSV